MSAGLCAFVLLATLADARTTEIGLSQGYIEMNPAMPKRPSDGLLYGSGLAGAAISCYAMRSLERPGSSLSDRQNARRRHLAWSIGLTVGGLHMVYAIHNDRLLRGDP